MIHPIVAKANRAAQWRSHLKERCGTKETFRMATPDLALMRTSEYFGIDADLIRSRSRAASVLHARQVGMYVARVTSQASLPAIGRSFGGFDHSTVLNNVRAIENRMPTNSELRDDIAMIKTAIARGW